MTQLIRIAIVEDEERDRARLRACLNDIARQDGVLFDISEYPSGMAFLGNYTSDFDIVFMDIEMPGMDGMETARLLRRTDETVILIFVTNMAQYAILGYEVEALDFILKPINPYSFAMKVRRAVARTAKRADEAVQIRTEWETFSVDVASIRYLEVTGHYVVYHTAEGELTEYITLKDAQSKLDRPFFVRCNRSTLVNLRYVTSVGREEVRVGKEALPFSRPQRKPFLDAFSQYIGGGK